MELRHLRYFQAVAEELNFGRAAQKLRIAQPPLSQQIRSLEEHLGVELFRRNKHKVELTRAGQTLLREARQVMGRVRRMEQLARHLGQGQTGSLVISCGPTIMGAVLRPVLPVFTRQYPSVSLEFREQLTGPSLQGLREGTVDVAFLVPPFAGDDIIHEAVLRDRFVVAVPWNHRLAGKASIWLTELAEEHFVMLAGTVASGYQEQVMDLCRRAGFVPKFSHVTTSVTAKLLLVETGAGVTLVPGSLSQIYAHRVKYLNLRDSKAEVQFAAAWRHNDRSRVLHAFLEVMRRCLAETRTKKSS